MKKVLVHAIVPLAFLAAGAVILTIGMIRLEEARSSRSWPSTEGQVTASEVDLVRYETASGRGERRAEHVPRITYEYRVDGQLFTSDRISFAGFSFSNHAAAAAVTATYPKGRTVTVWYDPVHPDRAILEPGLTLTAYILPAFGALLAISSVLAWVFPRLRELVTSDRS